ncbi:MAG: hypothetical protein E7638_02995 [Ruminococcaceae bacterium]|nr:hypothetical protein [Oscillospiraceae bacterium]
MAKINVVSKLRSVCEDAEETFSRTYCGNGLVKEQKNVTKEVDYFGGYFTRESKDNGKTWSEWETHFSDDNGDVRHGKLENSPEGDELLTFDVTTFPYGVRPTLYDPKSGCTVGAGGNWYYLNGHDKGYFAWWEKGEDNVRPHAYFMIRYPDGREVRRLIELEEGGADFDPENPRNPAYVDKNRISAGNMRLLPDGDIAFELYPNMRLCCEMAGVDVNTFFPSCPETQQGWVFVRGHWNAEKQDYDFTYSNPVMLSDLQSSRGIMEPLMADIAGGRKLLVFRGSNMQLDVWKTRISPAAPGFKWYTYSDDGGRTFVPPMPWHFDTREVVYSPASMSTFFRSKKNGKLYWIGNIVDPWLIDGNQPRYPLQICEVDEEHGYLIKDTLTVIETIRDGQTSIELSNFVLAENPETLELELRITKCNFDGKCQEEGYWYSEAWEYYISFEE